MQRAYRGRGTVHSLLRQGTARTIVREGILRVLLSRMRHDGCGGRPGRVELLSVIIEGVSSRPVRRIVGSGSPSSSGTKVEPDARWKGNAA